MLIGTSGWQYRDWRGGLYPEGVPQRLWPEQYATHYVTVENNNSFYRLNNDPGRAAVINSAQFANPVHQARRSATRTPKVGQVAATAAIPTW